MRIILGVVAIILATAPVGAVQYGQMMGSMPPPTSRSVPKETVMGYLVDKPCAKAAVASTHSVRCAIAAQAQEAGLGVFSGGKWIPFDEKGSKKAAEFLKKSGEAKNAIVSVTGRYKGDLFAVSNIEFIKH